MTLKALKHRSRILGLTLADVAKLAEISEPTLYRWMAHWEEIPAFKRKALFDALDRIQTRRDAAQQS